VLQYLYLYLYLYYAVLDPSLVLKFDLTPKKKKKEEEKEEEEEEEEEEEDDEWKAGDEDVDEELSNVSSWLTFPQMTKVSIFEIYWCDTS